jgi:hypothetical protein
MEPIDYSLARDIPWDQIADPRQEFTLLERVGKG